MKLDIAKKLTVLFLAFGLIPVLVVGIIAYQITGYVESEALVKFRDKAVGIADKLIATCLNVMVMCKLLHSIMPYTIVPIGINRAHKMAL